MLPAGYSWVMSMHVYVYAVIKNTWSLHVRCSELTPPAVDKEFKSFRCFEVSFANWPV